MENIYYEGNVYWAYDHEISEMNYAERYFIRHLSFSPPLSKHQGNFSLTDRAIVLEAEEEKVTINLSTVTQLYLGFDEVYSSASAKNFGMFWKPLRIEFEESVIYIVVDYKFGFTANDQIFELLKELC